MLNRIFRTYTFRFTVLYVLIISVSASAISTAVYLFNARNYFKNVEAGISVELKNAVDSFERAGVEGFENYLTQKRIQNKGKQYYFSLIDKDEKTIIAGNLQNLPRLNNQTSLFFTPSSTLSSWGQDKHNQLVGRYQVLGNGQQIAVTRYYDDVNQRVELVAWILIQSTIVTILLGIIGGAIISANLIRLLDALNHSIANIMQGNLSERLPISQRNGEIDQLARQLNIMLSKIESSMNDVRQVSDNIAHDLRTPLTRLRNKLSTLEKRSSPENRENVRDMLVEADHLLSICSALLRIARIESCAKRADFKQVDVDQVFVDVVELYEPLASVKGIELAINCHDKASIQGDKDLLFQMLANLIDNAIKYTPDGGEIITELYVRHNMIYIVFADNGLGVPKEKYDKVFQRFYRVEESRGIQPGNGLGLSLVYAVAVLHGGSIDLSDSLKYFPNNPTPGLTFTIKLPLHVNYLA